MRQRHRNLIFLFTITIFLFSPLFSAIAYDDINGVEYDDIVDLSFRVLYNGTIKNDYPPESPFQMKVSPLFINEVYVDFILGMKVGETKPYISWTSDTENGPVLVEYIDNTLIRVVKDSTPAFGAAWKIISTILYVALGLGAVVGSVYLYMRFRPRLASKGCVSCSNRAYLKCAKCGSFQCKNCSTSGCSSCGSSKFIRLT